MLNLAIIGCGQIGSRHLQSLALLEEPARIHLVDPSEQSLDTAESRFAQAVSKDRAAAFQLIRHPSPVSLPAALDLALITSSSAHRAGLCESLLAHTNPGFLILEKFLFQKKTDYGRIGKLLKRHQVPAYVNQWMATTFAFQRIASWLGAGPVEMSVSGRGWGLCCNAVHYIEPFQQLTGHLPCRVNSSNFQTGFQSSKRQGYCELHGSLEIRTQDGSQLRLQCDSGDPEDAIHIRISSGGKSVQVDFHMDRFQCHFKDDVREWDDLFWIPMQSRLTHRFVHQLLAEGKCRLPDFTTSAAQHLLVLEPFLNHFRKSNPDTGDICPIT